MNINDIDEKEIPIPSHNSDNDRLRIMWGKQLSLAQKYHEIEHKNGFDVGDSLYVNVDTPKGQARLKEFSWRVTEELMEALEALKLGHDDHFWEEISDSMHFLLELEIMLDNKPLDIYGCGPVPVCRLEAMLQDSTSFECLSDAVLQVVYYLGIAMNCLKQKPWKQSHQLTDKVVFFNYIDLAFRALLDIYATGGKDADFAYKTYFKKSLVNNFRMESNY